ncbi:nitric oxide reductase NorF protein [Mycoplana sp. BE70]|uniref:cytochrome C oxidase subunit IV family protein n=1 Tax=Mycoplana sp. BE70 TaxID=2817775 RepID=UPI00285B8366|nr:cytochrome C oxidase subunit IV family protein [Mycoplana sp. BE70]MDR6756308.1 nitric oxide reductase NorF protein [Mycoplana sp. BE70]
MKTKSSVSLFASTNWILMMGIVSGLIAAQWKHEALPLAAIVTILVLTVFKARLIILDFMHLRGERPGLAAALLAWPVFFTVAILAKSLAAGLLDTL